jgi:hypothetical protein
MEALIVLTVIIVGIVAFDVLAVLGGADSRPGYGDDHRRPLAS